MPLFPHTTRCTRSTPTAAPLTPLHHTYTRFRVRSAGYWTGCHTRLRILTRLDCGIPPSRRCFAAWCVYTAFTHGSHTFTFTCRGYALPFAHIGRSRSFHLTCCHARLIYVPAVRCTFGLHTRFAHRTCIRSLGLLHTTPPATHLRTYNGLRTRIVAATATALLTFVYRARATARTRFRTLRTTRV